LAIPCQDASACRVVHTPDGEPVLITIVADGAGSAARAEVGSQLACALLNDEMDALFEGGGAVRDITREFVTAWMTRLQNEVAARAEAEGLEPRDFACTCLAAIVGTDAAVFFQVGDGAIVILPADAPDTYCWIFWPQQGEYESETLFATEPRALEDVDYELIEGAINELALFTDGLQRLALHFDSQTAFAPFFRPMFIPLRQGPAGSLAAVSSSLADFLASERVTSRTDDDKTLVLATRRPAGDQTPGSVTTREEPDGPHDDATSDI
jgi:hypothetical protein